MTSDGGSTQQSTPHSCAECDGWPDACKAALIAERKRLEGIIKEHESEQGWYWHSRWAKLSTVYSRAREVLGREQMRADRLQSALIKAERALARYEGRRAHAPLPNLDEIQADPRPVPDAAG